MKINIGLKNVQKHKWTKMEEYINKRNSVSYFVKNGGQAHDLFGIGFRLKY